MLSDFLAVIGRSWTWIFKMPDGIWDKTVEKIMIEFSDNAHSIFCASSALERVELRSKEGSKKTNHFNGDEQNVELILRTVMSANQLSIYGAVADICTDVSKDTMASGKPEAHGAQDPFGRRWKFLPNLQLPTLGPLNSDGETCCKNTSNNSNDSLTLRSYPNYALTLV